jgi:hypothetical protein
MPWRPPPTTSLDTYVQASGQFRWQLVVDLSRAQRLGSMTVSFPPPHFATDFHVDASMDGASYTTVARRRDASGGLTPIQLDRSVRARYLRVVADRPNDGGQTGGQMAVSEIGAY